MTSDSPTFRAIVDMCGLSPMFAENAMARAIVRVGIWRSRMTPADMPAALPEIERSIKPFLGEAEVERVIHTMRKWWWRFAADEEPNAAVG